MNGIDVNDIESSSDLAETIYYICLKHLSETISKMPWQLLTTTNLKGKEKIFNLKLDSLLNLRPNPYMSATTFWGAVELNKLHYGNSFVYIEADNNGFPKYLWLLPSNQIEIWVDNAGIFGQENNIWYIWNEPRTGKRYSFEMNEVIHLKTHVSFDGLSGASIKEILSTQINTSKNSIAFLNKFYKSNMIGSKMIVHYSGEVDLKAKTRIIAELESFSSKQGSGRIIPLPIGMEAKTLDMKLADAQFFENNKHNALQLAAAFGIKPNIINDYSKSSYSNSESQQIDFFVNTLQPLFRSYEQEVSYKLLTSKELEEGYRLEMNDKVLFKMDNQTKADVYSKYLSNFIMTPNEVREELNLPYIEGGDGLVGNGATINLENIGNQYTKGGE